MSTCLQCKYRQPTEQPGMGMCNRNPPSVSVVPVQVQKTPANPGGIQMATRSDFPPVTDDMGCGAFVARSLAN